MSKKSTEISALKSREAKAWNVIDQLLSDRNKDKASKQRAAEFILKRLYPEKTVVAGDEENPLQVVAYIPKVKDET